MPKSEQGLSSDRYQVIPRTLIFIFNQDKVLLLKGSPTKRIWANLYNGIGGHIEAGEDVLSSARRELEEEAGITACDFRLVGTLLVDVLPDQGIVLFVLRGEYCGGVLKESSEGSLEWIDIKNFDDLPSPPDLKVILPIITQMKKESPPFSARSFYDIHDELRVVVTE
jgi:8-oxo-dGTP diphosphatase